MAAAAEPPPPPPTCGLMELAGEQKAGLFATFGGQGYAFLADARALWSDAHGLGRALIAAAASALLEELQAEGGIGAALVGAAGLDVVSWLEAEAPSEAHLHSAAVSYPLVGAVQMAQLAQTVAKLGTFEQFKRCLHGATGHSQGICSAVVLSMSQTMDEFMDNAVKMVR
eukprot:SAG31_NODE_2849_length_4994_cov_2.114694_3_plen_170_part_00